MNRKLRQAVSLLMSTTMILIPPNVSAYVVEKESNLCEHHTEHTEECKYTKELGEDSCEYECNPCSIISDKDDALDNSLVEDQDDANNSIIENEDDTIDDIIDDEDDIMLFAAPVNPQVVYTQATKTNSDKSGNGSRSNPYNRFEDAVANVEDGGTIIIKSGKNAFLNTQDEYGKVPFIIDKDITIRSEDDSTMADLVVRAGGIILQGDVTFKNINLGFANKLHDGIFANGYKLEIINTVRNSGSREVDLFAGSLYEKGTDTLIQGHIYDDSGIPQLVTPQVGNHASIILETTDRSTHSQFGKIFAGSMNGDFDGDVNIEVKDGGNLEFISIHSSGAEESDPGNMFDFNEPAPPTEKPDEYTVDGTVNIDLTDVRTNVYGAGATEVNVNIKTEYPISQVEIDDINKLTVTEGTIIPDSISWKNGNAGDIDVSNKDAKLDLSVIKDFTVNNFSGGGKITLPIDGLLTIDGDISGETIFETPGGAIGVSGPVMKDHVYIRSNSNEGTEQSFKFIPNGRQSSYRLEKVGSEWKIQADITKPTLPNTISTLEFNTKESSFIFERNAIGGINGVDFARFEYFLGPEIKDDSILSDLPVEIYIADEKLTKKVDVDGYISWISQKLGLEVTIDGNVDPDVSLFELAITGDLDNTNLVKPGTYEVIFALPDYNLSASTTLHVVEKSNASGSQPENSEAQMTLSVNGQTINNQTPVSFNNKLTISADIQQKIGSTLPFALQNEVDFLVNGKVIGTAPVVNNTASLTVDITKANHFVTGSNEIKLLFGGSDTLTGSIASTTLEVEKVKPKIKLSSDIKATYDGKQHALTATVENLKDVKPTIAYYTNAQYTGGKTEQPPMNVGTYYAEVSLPEGETYEGITLKQGQVAITKATPDLILSGTVINNEDKSMDLKVYANIRFPEGASTPIGVIEFELRNGNNTQVATETLRYGTTSHVFKNLSEGTYTVSAKYIPTVDTINDQNYIGLNNIQESFEVVDGFVPVQDVEFISPELQLTPDTSGMTLPYTITPHNATNQSVVWESSNPNIISVDPVTGKLEIKGRGTALITIRTKDGAYSHSSQITVVENTSNSTAVQSISLDKTNLVLDLNGTDTQMLNATIAPHNATNKNIIWKSENDDIATVDDNGNVIARAVGRTKIKAITQDSAKIATSEIEVIDSSNTVIKVTGMTIQEGNFILEKGQKKMLTPVITPSNASDKSVLWTSSHPEVAEITEKGMVIAKSLGHATITATAKDGSGVTATSTVTVTPSSSNGNGNESGGSSDDNGDSSGGNNSNTPSKPQEENKPVTPPTKPTPTDNTQGQPKPTVTVSQFKDVTDSWAKKDIQFVIEKGLFQGMSDSTFGVNEPMTRAMLVTVLHRLADTPQVGTAAFADVKDGTFYADAVAWANTLGIVSGVNQSEFAPNQIVTREQLAVMFYQYAKVLGLVQEDTLANKKQFKDSGQISNWSEEAIQWATKEGILLGNPDGTLNPKGVATRAQVATITRRFVELVEK